MSGDMGPARLSGQGGKTQEGECECTKSRSVHGHVHRHARPWCKDDMASNRPAVHRPFACSKQLCPSACSCSADRKNVKSAFP